MQSSLLFNKIWKRGFPRLVSTLYSLSQKLWFKLHFSFKKDSDFSYVLSIFALEHKKSCFLPVLRLSVLFLSAFLLLKNWTLVLVDCCWYSAGEEKMKFNRELGLLALSKEKKNCCILLSYWSIHFWFFLSFCTIRTHSLIKQSLRADQNRTRVSPPA